MAAKFETVDEYIGSFPATVQAVLQEVRRTIHDAVPDAGERISYQIPTITVEGKSVVYFAGLAEHISVYPIPEVDGTLAEQMEPYLSGKGTLKFPLNEPIPYALIADVAGRLDRRRP